MSYWDKRAIDLENLEQTKTEETIKRVNMLFDRVIKVIDTSIEQIFETFSGKLSQDTALKLLNTKQTKEVRKELERLYNETTDVSLRLEIMTRLNAPAYASRISRLEALKDVLTYEFKAVGVEVEQMAKERLIDTFADSYYRTTYDIQKKTCAYDFTKLSNPALKSAISTEWKGGNYSSRIWKNTDKLITELQEIVTVGIATGQSLSDMCFALQLRMQSEKYNATRLIRTEVNYVCNQGVKSSLEVAEIEKYRFIATLDLRTSSTCRNLDGTIHELSKAKVGENYPPMHPHCRSVASAYVKGRDISKLKRRARNPITNKTELVPKGMTYHEWYAKYVKGNSTAEMYEKFIKRGINPY